MKEELLALYAVQQLDSAVDTLKRRFTAMDPGRGEKAAYDAARLAHDSAEAELHRLAGELRDAELEHKSIETKRATEEKKLYGGSVTGAKELMNLQEEVDALARQLERIAARVESLRGEAAQAGEREAAAKQERARAAASLKTVNGAYKEEAERMQAQGRLLGSQRKEAVAAVPPALFQRYEAMRPQKDGVALAAIQDGNTCSGCRMALPSTLVRRVKETDEIVMCDQCGRMLCLVPQPPAPTYAEAKSQRRVATKR